MDVAELAWIELGDWRVETVEAEMPRGEPEPEASSSVVGQIGLGVLRRCRLVLDVPGRRAAFVAR